MAFIQCDFFSQVLGFSTSMNVILPDFPEGTTSSQNLLQKTTYPTLYLLHGLSNDHTIWARRTSIDRYVRYLNIAVVMPNAGRSFYTDMKHGYNYYQFISEELPMIAESFFPLSAKREDRFIAGVSMGGYGSLKIALSKPEKFAAAASLSGAVDIKALAQRLILENATQGIQEFNNIFGELSAFNGSEHDLFTLARRCSRVSPKPKIYTCCGNQDFLYKDNVKLRNYIKTLDLDFTYEEEEGTHEWDYWDTKIQSVLHWLPLQSN